MPRVKKFMAEQTIGKLRFADTIAAFPSLLDPASGVIKAVVTL